MSHTLSITPLTIWAVGKSIKSLLVTFICFSVGSAFCMEGGFHTFKVSLPQKRNQTQPQMTFFRFLIVLVPLDLHYCGFHFGSRLQSDGDMVVTNIFVTSDECVKQSVTHISNTASNILLPSSLWWVFPNLIWPKPNPYSYFVVSHTSYQTYPRPNPTEILAHVICSKYYFRQSFGLLLYHIVPWNMKIQILIHYGVKYLVGAWL